MNDDERRLATLLHRATPLPPSELDADVLMDGLHADTPRRRYWPQFAAAAAVVVIAGGAAIATNLGHGGPARVAGSSPSSHRSASTSHAISPCRLSQLALSTSLIRTGPGGHREHVLNFRNRSAVSCSLHDYPDLGIGASSRDNHGKAGVLAPRETPRGPLGGLPAGAAPATIDLRPGQAAYASFEFVDSARWPTFVYRLAVLTDGREVVAVSTGRMPISSYPLHGAKPPETTLEVHPYQRYRG